MTKSVKRVTDAQGRTFVVHTYECACCYGLKCVVCNWQGEVIDTNCTCEWCKKEASHVR